MTVVPEPTKTVSRRLDHGGRSPGDALLLGGMAQGDDLAEALVCELACRQGTAMRAGERTLAFEKAEIAADRDLGDAKIAAQGGDPHGALGAQARP